MGVFSSVRLVVIVSASCLISCGHSAKTNLTEESSVHPPAAILVDRVISGNVLGSPLRQPFGLAVDARGMIYCVDAGNSRVIQFSFDMIPTREIGGAGTATGLLGRSTFVTVDNELNLFVSDEGNQRLTRFNSRLNVVDEIPFYDSEEPLKFGYPSGIGSTSYGELWVADRDLNRIAVFDNVGQFDRFIGEFGYPGGQLRSPEKIVRDRAGHFLVCDAGNSRVMIYDEYGNFARTFTDKDLDYPIAAAMDKAGSWILDGSSGHILFVDEKGNRLFMTGPQIAGNDIALKNPSDIILLPDRRLVISDTDNNRLLICRIIDTDQ